MIKNIGLRNKDWFYYLVLKRALMKSKTVLDLGCGEHSPLSNIPKTFYSVGVDIFLPSITKSKKKKLHDKYIKCNLLAVDKFFKPKSFDSVVLLDVVEHFSKEDAYRMLSKAEKIANKNVVVLTPNGYYKQDPYGKNPYQIHKSGWSVKDLQKKGYNTRGLRGYKSLRGEYATIYKKPWLFWAILSFLSEPLLYFFPDESYDLFAIKVFKV